MLTAQCGCVIGKRLVMDHRRAIWRRVGAGPDLMPLLEAGVSIKGSAVMR